MEESKEEQEKVIKSNLNKQIIVNAPPGTGKTYTVSKKIEYIVKNRIAPIEQILVICFSRSAVKEIEEEHYKEIFNSTTYDARIEYVLKMLQNNQELQNSIKNMKHIIIDEVQDIVRYKSRTNIRNVKNIQFRFYIVRR